MKDKKYSSDTWLDSRVEARESKTHRKGLFAREPIKAGEKTIVVGGHLFTREEVRAGKYRKGSLLQIGDNFSIGSLPTDPVGTDEFLNHSCDPNLWLIDAVTLVARRDIKEGEELTADYSTWTSDSDWKLRSECNCGSPLCRKVVTGDDWKKEELQKRYRRHFSPYLEEKIKRYRGK